MNLARLLVNVRGWDDLGPIDWAWIIISALLGAFVIAFSFIMPFQNWIVTDLGWYWLKAPAVMTGFWLAFWAVGHNTLTVTYSLIEKWHWNALTIAVVLILSALIGLSGLVEKIWDVIRAYGGSYGWTLLGGIILIVVALVFVFATRRNQPNP